MTINIIKNIAKKHKIDFLKIENTVNAFKLLIIAPYLSKKFIEDMERNKPVHILIDYEYSKGFIHWLAWKLRIRKK